MRAARIATWCLVGAALVHTPRHAFSQQQPAAVAQSAPVQRLAGIEQKSDIQYVRFVLAGKLRPLPSPQTTAVDSAVAGTAPAPPLLMAQCSLHPNGKYLFEMFTSFGGDVDLAFYPPWTPASANELFPPRTEKVTITMDFLGYTHVKPLRRQWEIPVQTPGEYRYNPPGGGSSNLEEIAYDLRYLLALPTLRLTLGTTTTEFLTTPLLNEVRKEPLCRAAGLSASHRP